MKKRKYPLIVAQPFLCVAAILEIILKKEGYNQYNQQMIAESLGVNIPIDHKSSIKNINYTMDSNKWGIVLKNNTLTNWFMKNNINLVEDFISIFTISEFKFLDIINQLLITPYHLVCGFDYGYLYNKQGNKIGHVSLIIGTECEQVILLDPGPDQPGEKMVNGYDLFSAIKRKEDGIWIVKKLNRVE